MWFPVRLLAKYRRLMRLFSAHAVGDDNVYWRAEAWECSEPKYSCEWMQGWTSSSECMKSRTSSCECMKGRTLSCECMKGANLFICMPRLPQLSFNANFFYCTASFNLDARWIRGYSATSAYIPPRYVEVCSPPPVLASPLVISGDK